MSKNLRSTGKTGLDHVGDWDMEIYSMENEQVDTADAWDAIKIGGILLKDKLGEL